MQYMENSKEEYEKFMRFAIEEAQKSLKSENDGFGALIIKNNSIIAKAHDRENTEQDPTSHAELNVLRLAVQRYGKQLNDCILISTHEPCPMCATAIVWANLRGIVYSVSIKEAIKLGRTRIDISCEEIIRRAQAKIWIIKGVLKEQCIKLYK